MTNNKNIPILIAVAAALLLLVGCAKEQGQVDAGSITVKASIGPLTKVQYETDGKSTSFTAGDKIAVYGWTGGADAVPDTRVVDGVLNTLEEGGTWTPESPMRWKPGGEAHYFLGIYPAPESVSSFTAADFTLDPAKYTDSDLLVATNLKGVTASQGPVALAFDHLMARLDVNLKFRGELAATPTVSSVTALARSAATVNYLTKEVTAKGDASAVAIPAAESASDGYALSFSGIQVPQEGVRKISVTIGGKEYVYESATGIPLNAGQYSTLNLVVGKDKIELTGVTVSDWTAQADLPGGEAGLVITASRYLTFIAEREDKISLLNDGGNAPKLYYSYDKTNWTQWDYSALEFTSSTPLYLCGDNPDGFSFSNRKYSQFVDSGNNYSISGDIMSLLNKDAELKEIPNAYCFYQLFGGCNHMKKAPELPATTLTAGCYALMFRDCSALNSVKCLAIDISAADCVKDWMTNVADRGTFITAEEKDWPSGASGIPSGWTAIPEAVDLGLSVKWATCNVGAVTPGDYGDYFAWDDVASKTYDGSWRLPTNLEYSELVNYCTYSLTIYDGVNAGYFKSKKNTGYIYLPAAGYYDSRAYDVGTKGYYWSSDENAGDFQFALTFQSGASGVKPVDKAYALPVRLVKEK